ncbi:hypothetical protein HELRODRAFT_178089 [Helobdella robusta]|uniref:Uncharacterized protein n=1 Tax=Helobdella robusta TaxID=6412 RepID=T1FCQ0_HELRO|nr:hypothetical protein HELRODRAFT_178089 [Helobdella robusta]ESN97305.1 hypothetical protein HELRODRAFT_178089 [Helobdella robusta]
MIATVTSKRQVVAPKTYDHSKENDHRSNNWNRRREQPRRQIYFDQRSNNGYNREDYSRLKRDRDGRCDRERQVVRDGYDRRGPKRRWEEVDNYNENAKIEQNNMWNERRKIMNDKFL